MDSTLSPNVSPFVPKDHQITPQQTTLSPNVAEFVPTWNTSKQFGQIDHNEQKRVKSVKKRENFERNNLDSEFPVLSSTTDNENIRPSIPKTEIFRVSFSEKLKSQNFNTAEESFKEKRREKNEKREDSFGERGQNRRDKPFKIACQWNSTEDDVKDASKLPKRGIKHENFGRGRLSVKTQNPASQDKQCFVRNSEEKDLAGSSRRDKKSFSAADEKKNGLLAKNTEDLASERFDQCTVDGSVQERRIPKRENNHKIHGAEKDPLNNKRDYLDNESCDELGRFSNSKTFERSHSGRAKTCSRNINSGSLQKDKGQPTARSKSLQKSNSAGVKSSQNLGTVPLKNDRIVSTKSKYDKFQENDCSRLNSRQDISVQESEALPKPLKDNPLENSYSTCVNSSHNASRKHGQPGRTKSDTHAKKHLHRNTSNIYTRTAQFEQQQTASQDKLLKESTLFYKFDASDFPPNSGDVEPSANVHVGHHQNRHSATAKSMKQSSRKDISNIDPVLGKTWEDNQNVLSGQSRPFLSYSDMLKRRPLDEKPPVVVQEERSGILMVTKEQLEDEGEHEEGESGGKKKKKKKKKKSTELIPQAVKKTKTPIMFDFGEMFQRLEENVVSKRKIIRAGGLLPTQAPTPKKQEDKTTPDSKVVSSNPLDSTAPIVYRKKERENPKKKKPSTMRKLLTKEREERKLAKDENEDKISDGETVDPDTGNNTDEETEQPSCEEILKAIHSRKFREYCNHDLDYDINGAVMALLKELIRFQDRLYQKDPVKAKARRRFVCGLREVFKHVKLRKLKCVIVTPNLEPTKCKGGLNDILSNIIEHCHEQNVPAVFALNRQTLGKVLRKKVPVSIVGIFYYDGAQNYFKTMMSLTDVARQTYEDKFQRAKEAIFLENKRTKCARDTSDPPEPVQEMMSDVAEESEDHNRTGDPSTPSFETVNMAAITEIKNSSSDAEGTENANRTPSDVVGKKDLQRINITS